MNIKTKFNFGQRIQHITRGSQQVNIVCPLCHGNKKIQVVGIVTGKQIGRAHV